MAFIRRSWIEIDTEALKENLSVYRTFLGSGQEIMAVIKADAYGLGDTEVFRIMKREGVRYFAVSNLEEALRVEDGCSFILILGYTPEENLPAVAEHGFTQAILSEEYAERCALRVRGENKLKVHFAIDTGMNRIGLDGDDPEACERIIRRFAPKFNVTGIFTHLCVADTESENAFTQSQIEKFRSVADRLADMNLPYVHCLNSAGGLWHNSFGNLVRLGIILYGLKPSFSNTLPAGIRPVIRWKSVVSMVKKISAGESIGYGRTRIAKHDMTVATIPTGYADGYPRALSNRGCVFIHGEKAEIVGRICMDQMMVDVTDLRDVQMGDEVLLLGDNYTADHIAEVCGTIGYEIICNINKRVPRVYI